MSGRCVAAAAEPYGSLVMTTSPGSSGPDRLERVRVADAAEARHAELDRVGEELARRVEQAAGEVGRLLHERRVRRPLDDVGHLLDGALQVVPEDLHGQRVQTHQPSLRRTRLPKRSTSPTWPAGTSTVVSGCSTMAGPARRAPRAERGAIEDARLGGAAVEPDPARRARHGRRRGRRHLASGTRGRSARSCTRRFTISAGASRSAWPNARSCARWKAAERAPRRRRARARPARRAPRSRTTGRRSACPPRDGRWRPRAGAVAREPVGQLGPERVVLLARAPRPSNAPTPSALAAPAACTVRTASFTMSALIAPSAQSVPGERGTKTVGMPTSRATQRAHDRPGAAEGDEREVARVHRGAREDLGELRVHVRDGHPDHALGRLVAASSRADRRSARWPPRRARGAAASARRGTARDRGSRRRGTRR